LARLENCSPTRERTLREGHAAIALWDRYPFNLDHVLLIPHRHIAWWFEATAAADRDDMLRPGDDARRIVLETRSPNGFNLGMKDGAIAGRTTPRLRLDLIPRHRGDNPGPRGGLRWIHPGRVAY